MMCGSGAAEISEFDPVLSFLGVRGATSSALGLIVGDGPKI